MSFSTPLARTLLLALILLGATSGCEMPFGPNESEKTKQVTVTVSGMACAKGCAPRVREALASLPWAKNVQVDFDRKQATFTADVSLFNEVAVKKVLEDAGFEGQVQK